MALLDICITAGDPNAIQREARGDIGVLTDINPKNSAKTVQEIPVVVGGGPSETTFVFG